MNVAVVGFGVAGATVAALLARDGHDVTLIERAAAVGAVGAGVLLQPSGQAILERLGLLHAVTRTAEPIDELHAQTHRGDDLIRLPYAEIAPGCRAYGLHRGELFAALHEQVAAQNVRVVLGVEIASLADVAALGRFDFVIAADGARSALRAEAGLTRWRHEYAHGAIWAIGRGDTVRGKLHQIVRGTGVLLGLLPMGGGRCSLFWSLRHDRKAALWRRGFSAWKDEVVALCPLAEPLFETVTDWDHVAYTRYQHVVLRSWFDDDDRTLFLGDAAHAMSPHLGQGINLALMDALLFAGCLRRRAPDFRAAFRDFAALRSDHIRYYAAVTLLLTPFFQSDGWLLGAGRDVALPRMTRVPWLRRRMLLTMAGTMGNPWRATPIDLAAGVFECQRLSAAG